MSSEPRVVFVTGASKGIGLAIAAKLLADSHRVASFARTLTEPLKTLASKYPDSLLTFQGDVTDAAAETHAIQSVLKKFGRLDALVLNAGQSGVGPVSTVSVDDWRKTMEINFFSTIPAIQAALPALRESKGRIILISSPASEQNAPGLGGYCTSKAALNSLARSLAAEEPHVTSLAVHPGFVETDMLADFIVEAKATGGMPPEVIKQLEDGRLHALKPEVPGGEIAWIALHASSSLSGKYLGWNDKEIKALSATV